MKTALQDITVPNKTESLEKLRRFVLEFLAESPFPARQQRLLVLAIDEAVTSNILFSEACNRNGTTRVTIDLDETRLAVRIQDTGRDMDSENEEHFDEYARNARRFEMGIHLIRQIMDEMHYVYRKGFQNDLELIKFT